MNKNKILLTFIYIAGSFSLLIFIITKNETLMEFATKNMFTDGDLYRFAKILHFKTPIPYPDNNATDLSCADSDTASIIIIGDSFIETCRGHDPFPLQLSEKLNRSVFPVYAGIEPEFFDPVFYCWKNSLDPDRKRIIILERVERYIIDSFGDRHREDSIAFERKSALVQHSQWRDIKRRWFTGAERNYQVFFSSSDFTSPLIELWNTLRFSIFKQISDETPVYSFNPPFLFEKEEVVPDETTSYYYAHSDSLILQIANNILRYQKILRSRYNAELVFMPVPNPYTLYHTFINNDRYDDFIPRLCEKLEQKGVRTISLYRKFCESKDVLYFPTDTHWNAKGAQIAVDEAVRFISEFRERIKSN